MNGFMLNWKYPSNMKRVAYQHLSVSYSLFFNFSCLFGYSDLANRTTEKMDCYRTAYPSPRGPLSYDRDSLAEGT